MSADDSYREALTGRPGRGRVMGCKMYRRRAGGERHLAPAFVGGRLVEGPREGGAVARGER
jgi:hypothetical protein